jgi:putative DNA primase/helicase
MALTVKDKEWAVAVKLFDENLIFVVDSFYKYDEDKGIWKEYEEQRFNYMADEIYRDTTQEKASKKEISEIKADLAKMTWKKYLKQIKATTKKRTHNTINLKDGIFNLETKESKPYEKEDFCFNKLDHNYNPDAKCERWISFLIEIFTPKTGYFSMEKMDKDGVRGVISLLQEFMGYSLLIGNNYEKMLMLVGSGRNGKGVILETWQKMLGKHNVSDLDIKDINNTQSVWQAENKMLNISWDADANQQIDSGNIKLASVGEPVQSRKLYENPKKFEFSAKIVIATNKKPHIKTAGDAIRERLIIIPFNRYFEYEERDFNLKSKLSEEIEGIFAWSMRGLDRLVKRSGKFVVPQLCKDYLQDYITDEDSVLSFLSEETEESKVAIVEKKKIYMLYKDYCRENNRLVLSNRRFYKKIEMERQVTTVRRDGGYMYVGLKITGSSEASDLSYWYKT